MRQGEADPVTAYISAFPPSVRKSLEELRAAIKSAAPAAEETVSYGIPTFDLNGHLVHFAAYKRHIGFYPTPSGIKAFRKELAGYKTSAGTVQFPLDKPLPLGLVKKIVKFRITEKNFGVRSRF